MIGQFDKFSIQYKIDALRNNEKHVQAAKLQTTSCHRSPDNTYRHYTATMQGTFFGCTMQEILAVLLNFTPSLASIKHK